MVAKFETRTSRGVLNGLHVSHHRAKASVITAENDAYLRSGPASCCKVTANSDTVIDSDSQAALSPVTLSRAYDEPKRDEKRARHTTLGTACKWRGEKIRK
jgi:hypothetical protein